MTKQLAIIFLLLVAALAVGFLIYKITLPHPEIIQVKDEGVTYGDAYVDSVDLVYLESFPVQIQAKVAGNLADPCTEIAEVNEIRQDKNIYIKIKTSRPNDATCAQVLTPFEKVVPLAVKGLKAGTYQVDINGAKKSFTLTQDNFLSEEDLDTSNSAPTGRELLQIID